MNILITANESLSYATEELIYFLNKYTNVNVGKDIKEPNKTINLFVDNILHKSNYNISGNSVCLKISGGSLSAVLCGVYDALAEGGIFFEATGYSVPRAFDLEVFFNVNKKVNPKFRLRGIRQHINFPMDVSSYTLKEAKEYIRSLARMRYNAITFHSYPGQWHEVNTEGEKDTIDKHTGRIHGNIGVTTSQQMLQSELDIARFNIIQEITNLFMTELCICVYE